MKAIMYHYVRPDDPAFPFSRHLRIDDFCAQLDWFRDNFDLPARDNVLAALNGAPWPDNGMILTFDDGLVDHHRHVLPELEARGLWGLFYIPVGYYQTGRVLDVHRVHLLLSRSGGAAVLTSLEEILLPHMLAHAHVEEFRSLTYALQDNDATTTLVKRILNYFIDRRFRPAVLDRLMERHMNGAEPPVYMEPDDIRDLHRRGMLIGSHGVSHQLMSLLPPSEQEHEIRSSFAFLDDVVGEAIVPRSFCYPYGGFHSFTCDTERLLAEAGCRFSFNVESRPITAADIAARPHALPRYDCNQFPFGQCRPSLS